MGTVAWKPLVCSNADCQAMLTGQVQAMSASVLPTVQAVPAVHGPAVGERDGTGNVNCEVTWFVPSGPGVPTVYLSGDNASLGAVKNIAEPAPTRKAADPLRSRSRSRRCPTLSTMLALSTGPALPAEPWSATVGGVAVNGMRAIECTESSERNQPCLRHL
jgi:hypothetical protein